MLPWLHRHSFVDISVNHPNLLKRKAQNVVLAEPSENKRFFYTCSTAIEADNRIGPSTNIVEENVDSDSEACPRGGFSWTIQSFSDGKERWKEKENSATEARMCCKLQVLASFRPTFDCSRHRGGTHRTRKTESLPAELTPSSSLLLPSPFFVPCSMSKRIANQ